MKLSTKIILPIILISALLILLAGCFGIPADESPGFTPGTITGIIVAPCGNTTGEPFSETSDSPEYWGYYCEEDWYLQADVEVVLTYGEDEVATTTTDEFGVYTFTDVPPGKNYVITAYYPDNNITLVKDVALELIEGGSFDAKNTDIVSTSLGLVVDFLIVDIGLTPDDISLDEVIADRPNFPNFPKFKILVIEVGKVLEDCGNVNTDGNVQAALYDAAEEISGDAPGFTEDTGDTGGGGAFIGGAAPAAVSHTLTVTIVGDGSVTVDGNVYTVPVTVDKDTSLALVATPASGWQFDGWSGDASASPVIMDADKAVTATFSEIPIPQYTLTVTIVGDGSVTVDGNVYTVPVTVDKDTSLALVATPASGWQFDGWSGDASASPVIMDADKAVTANFAIDESQWFTVDFVAGSNGSLTGTTTFPNILTGTAWGTAVTVPTPVPDSGYKFDAWTPVFPATVTASATYTANFTANTGCLLVKVYNPTGQGFGAGWVTLFGNSMTFGPYDTETNGWYTFTNIPEGTYTLIADRLGADSWIRPSIEVIIVIGTVCQEEALQYTTATE